jgi:hypothetical protein
MATKSSYLFASTCSLVLSLSFLTVQSSAVYAGTAKGQKIQYVPPKDLGFLSRSIPGIFRGDCIPDLDVTCLMALIPSPNSTILPRTISARPRFFFSVPKVSARAEFTLYEANRSGKPVLVYKTVLPVQTSSGVMGFTMPADAPALKLSQVYSWRFTLSNLTSPKDVFGTIQRIELNPSLAQKLQNTSPIERARIYANLGIWYDALQILAEVQQAKPDRQQPIAEWVDLLNSVNLGQLAMRPLVQSRL